jgi:hypothetical protein
LEAMMATIELTTFIAIASPPENGAWWNPLIRKPDRAHAIRTQRWFLIHICTFLEVMTAIIEMTYTNIVSRQINGTKLEGMECGQRVGIARPPPC